MGIMDGFTTAQESGKSTVKKVGIGGYSMFARVNDSTSYPSQVPVDVLEDRSFRLPAGRPFLAPDQLCLQ